MVDATRHKQPGAAPMSVLCFTASREQLTFLSNLYVRTGSAGTVETAVRGAISSKCHIHSMVMQAASAQQSRHVAQQVFYLSHAPDSYSHCTAPAAAATAAAAADDVAAGMSLALSKP